MSWHAPLVCPNHNIDFLDIGIAPKEIVVNYLLLFTAYPLSLSLFLFNQAWFGVRKPFDWWMITIGNVPYHTVSHLFSGGSGM